MNPDHIGFLTTEYPPLPSGGIGTSIRNLARALVAQGHRVTVLGWGRQAEFEDQGVRVRFLGHTRVPKMGWLLHRQLIQRECNRLVREEGLAILEAHDWGGPSAGLGVQCPVVIRCNGTATYFAHLLGETVRPSVRWAEWLALHQARSVTAVSQFTATVTQRLFRLRQPIGVLPNAIDVTQFRPASPDQVEPGTILYFGTLVRKKGVFDLGPIFSQVVEHAPRARLWVIGRDAPDRASGSPSTWAVLQGLFSPAARERVDYLGPQPYEQIQGYVQRAAVCVFPSYAEALPLTWLEAMACAKPIVAYDIGWAPELIASGVNGLLVPAGDSQAFSKALVAILADWKGGHELGLASRQRVEVQFSAGVVARQALAWYQGVR